MTKSDQEFTDLEFSLQWTTMGREIPGYRKIPGQMKIPGQKFQFSWMFEETGPFRG